MNIQAILDDPSSPPIYRTNGPHPHATSTSPLPLSVVPRRVVLRDRTTTATLIPFGTSALHSFAIPLSLLAYLAGQMNREIAKGDTYPMDAPFSLEAFGSYWFANFAAVMVLGECGGGASLAEVYAYLRETEARRNWERDCMGSFYIKPNYPGRSSHVCNGGFLVTDGARNRGVGRLMGESYLVWAPLLGYEYSVFNLVYETNVASVKIWDALGFKRIGRVKGCGRLKSFKEPVDALIFGRELGAGEAEDDSIGSEERFDRIRFYLRTGTYPEGADRAEKSRLRSAATHYRLVTESSQIGVEPEERLFLKDKEVIADPIRQYELAKIVHAEQAHGGINKTTASIAERYHWVRIKDTVTLVVKNCSICVECGKPSSGPAQATPATPAISEHAIPSMIPTRSDDSRDFQLPLDPRILRELN